MRQDFSPAMGAVRSSGGLTLGLMTPPPQPHGSMADPGEARELAQLAEAQGITALWVRDVPLAVPQGEDRLASSLDDPFQWLSMLAGATSTIALGTAAAVLPLRHPLHLAKTALSLDRISGGRLLLGVATGDRPEEFGIFGASLDERRDVFRDRWALLRSALSPDDHGREHLLRATEGYELMVPPAHRIPQVIVGSAKQTLQWNAAHADAWATYYRPFDEQKGRFGLWRQAVERRGQGNDPALKRAVQELGQWIGQSGNALVYGGSKTGLMGEIAKSVLDAGGTVTGVETTRFMQDDLQYDGLTELIVTETITERKTEMIRRGDAFIAFPGGTGTLEEIAEVMSKVSLKQLEAPCILYNLNGYYNGLKTLLDHMIETGLSTKERQEGIWFAENLEQIKQILKA